jgi:hypothetical protein
MYFGIYLWKSNGSCNARAHNTEKNIYFLLFHMEVLFVHTMDQVQHHSKNLSANSNQRQTSKSDMNFHIKVPKSLSITLEL